MEPCLMGPAGPFQVREPDGIAGDVIRDLGLGLIVDAMADGDAVTARMVRSALLFPLTDGDAILYRQETVRDAFALPSVFRGIREVCRETDDRRRSSWCWFVRDDVTGMFSGAVSLLELYLGMTEKLRAVLGKGRGLFLSRGMSGLLERLDGRFSDDFLAEARSLLRELSENGGCTFRASFGPSLEGAGYEAVSRRHGRLSRLLVPSFTLSERDDAGYEDIHVRRSRALAGTADILYRAAVAFENFFTELDSEVSFFIGALNLRDALAGCGVPVSFPDPLPSASRERTWRGLCDAALALSAETCPVGSDLDGESARLFFITGANQGGKTTFLRSVGEAQLMMQAGLPVASVSFRAPIRKRVLTHFRRKEACGTESGKLDEELRRMSDVCMSVSSGCLLLMNESFASTDEREGSLMASGMTSALVDHGVDIFSVTHLNEYASAFLRDGRACYLRAEHLEDGSRTFRIVRGLPEKTAYGMDIWDAFFPPGSTRSPEDGQR